MSKFRKKAMSAMSMLLAVLTFLPAESAQAADSTDSYNTNMISWSSTLPTGGNTDYKNDDGWYRLVLEYGDYCTNQINSAGEYTGKEEITSDADVGNSWPKRAWGQNNFDDDEVNFSIAYPANWPGSSRVLKADKGTLIRPEDQALYSNNEYSQDGMNSLYVKCAGYDEKTEQWMYYISPCDHNGNRQKRLWMVDCCLNMASRKIYYGEVYDYYAGGYATPACDGFRPIFTLLAPTFDQVKTEKNLTLAGVSLWNGEECDDEGLTDGEMNRIGGKIVGDYYNNEKWYIRQNTDGTWTIQSAGHFSWDWTKAGYGWQEWFGYGRDSTEALKMALSLFSVAQTFYYHALLHEYKYQEWVSTTYWRFESQGYENMASLFFLHGHLNVASTRWSEACAAFASAILYLNNYVENVYLLGGYVHRQCVMYGPDGKDMLAAGCSQTNQNEIGSLPGGLYLGYGIEVKVTSTLQQADYLMGLYPNEGKPHDGDKYPFNYHNQADYFGIKVQVQDSALSTVEPVYRNATVEEIQATLPYSYTSCWQPSKGQGAFDNLYVGKIMKTSIYGGSSKAVSVESSTAVTLGAVDKDGDGFCDTGARIGQFLGRTLPELAALYAEFPTDEQLYALLKWAQDGRSTGVTVTVEDGAVLNVEGPTFVGYGSTIVVKGNLNISPGAMLCPENTDGLEYDFWSRSGFDLIIDGGTVYISDGAMLDVGYANVTVKNGGSLINDGVFVHSIDLVVKEGKQISLQGGTIKNSSSAWFISGAEVRGRSRMTMIRNLRNDATLARLAANISRVTDTSLGRFTGDAYSAEDKDTLGIQPTILMSDHDEYKNMFQNSGAALLVGAVRNGGTKDKSSFMNGGQLYRARDIYLKNYHTSTIPRCSFTYHAKYTAASNKTADKDPTITAFNEIYNIDYVEQSIYGDEEADTKALKNNLLALKVGTGSQGTSGISNFKITYVDYNDFERCEYISPSKQINSYYYVLGYDFCGTTEDQKGNSKLIAPTGSTVLSASNFSRELEAKSNVVYLFQSTVPVKYVKSISLTGSGSGSWTCTELNLYKVRYLYPLEEYGYYSEDWYIPFSGDLIAEVALNNEPNGMKSQIFTWDKQTIDIGTGNYQLNIYDAPENIKTKTTNGGFPYFNVSHEKKSYSTQENDYVFSLSLADAELAGIEKLYNVDSDVSLGDLLSDAAFVRSITKDIKIDLNLTYLDTTGSARQINLPLTQSALDWAKKTMTADDAEKPIHGLFQQGEDIAVKGTLPDFRSVYEASVTYHDDGGTIAVTAASVSNPSYTNVSVIDGMLKVDYPETALYYYCASDTGGVKVNNGQTMNINMKAWNRTDKLEPAAKGSRYLVVLQTDSMLLAGTVNDLTAKFSYRTVNGTNFTTSTYALRNLVNEYCGYWLSDDGTNSECAYEASTQTGQQMYFVLDLANVYEFTSATFTLGKPNVETEKKTEEEEEEKEEEEEEEEEETEGSDITENEPPLDAWQMSSITIYELDELGERQVLLGTGVTTDTFSTNRTYFRDNIFGRRGAISRAKNKLLIAPGETKTISFETGEVGGNESVEENVATRIRSLSYESALQNFGFNARRVRYDLEIKVSGESITSAEDGDCGSKNQFYFQLVFQDDDGNLITSPCVLSNQQLQSDGFRTGTKEYCSIYTNDDYGTPVEINIIPDDTSSSSDVFDKLCLDYVKVSKTSNTGVSLTWSAEKIGWIDIEYKDDAEEQTGRSANQLIRSFDLVPGGYDVTLEFGIETATDYVDGYQYVGELVADITFRDSTGALDIKNNVPVIALIADYADREGSLQAVSAEGTDVSLSEFMFRKGYTNRFQLSFHDISTLVSIRFKVTSAEHRSLKINKVFARQVYDDGTLSYNVFNEYERYYKSEPQDLTATNNSGPMTISGLSGEGYGTLTFSSGNSIIINDTPGEEEIEVEEGDTQGENDKISVTAELADPTGISADATLPVEIIYKNIYGDAYLVKSSLVYDADTKKFMIPQYSLPKTPNIGMPYQVSVTGGALAGYELDAVTVNQIRSNQVIEEFVFAPEVGTKLLADGPVTVLFTESQQDEYAARKGYTSETQRVFLQLGSSTEKMLLTESQDLQLALVYTEKDDAYSYEHISDFVSVMDSGYTLINKGSILSIPLNLPKVDRVKAIKFKTSGQGMKVNVEKACISIEEISDLTGDALATGWTNLPTATGLISSEEGGTTMSSDGNTNELALASTTRLSPVNASLNLSAISRSDAVVKVTAYYLDTSGTRQSVSIEKSAKEWNRDSSWFLTSGLKTLQYYTLEVKDADSTNTAAVTVGSASVGWYTTEGIFNTKSSSGSIELTEGTVHTSPLVTTQLTGTAFNAAGTQSVSLKNSAASGSQPKLATAGAAGSTDTITLIGGGQVTVTASLPCYPGELEIYAVNAATGEALLSPVSAGATAESLTATIPVPTNTTNDTVRYTVCVRSKTLPDTYSATFTIAVEPIVYIEGVVLTADGTKLAEFSTLSGVTGSTFYSNEIRPGDELRFYARITHNSSGMKTGMTPSDGSAFTLMTTPTASLAGYEGTWTLYTLKMADVSTPTVCSFTVTSIMSAEVGYSLSFVLNPAAATSDP